MSPLILTSADNRFYEIYVGEETRSYEHAVFITEPVYRRDVMTGGSTLLFADKKVAAWESAYLERNPGERLLDLDGEEGTDVEFAASGEIDILGVVGPYVLFDQRAILERADYQRSDSSRGAVDIRSGGVVPLSAMVRDSTLFSAGGVRDRQGVRWRHARYDVVARFDSASKETQVVLIDTHGREWLLGYVDSRLPRIFWLDEARVDPKLRTALADAFDNALSGDGDTQLADGEPAGLGVRYAASR